MSHDTHHGHSTENKSKSSFSASFWLIIIIVGLFVAALNFIQAESGHEAEGSESEHRAEHGKLLMESRAGHTGPESDVKQAAPGEHEDVTTDTAAHKAEH